MYSLVLSLTFVLAESGSPTENELPFTHQQLVSLGVETSAFESAKSVIFFMVPETVEVPPIQKTLATGVIGGKRLLESEINREQVRLQRDSRLALLGFSKLNLYSLVRTGKFARPMVVRRPSDGVISSKFFAG